jgi:hypothetical protein
MIDFTAFINLSYYHCDIVNESLVFIIFKGHSFAHDKDTFQVFLGMVGRLKKEDTVMRKSISPAERLDVTLNAFC